MESVCSLVTEMYLAVANSHLERLPFGMFHTQTVFKIQKPFVYQQSTSLRENLMRGGVTDETIALLSNSQRSCSDGSSASTGTAWKPGKIAQSAGSQELPLVQSAAYAHGGSGSKVMDMGSSTSGSQSGNQEKSTPDEKACPDMPFERSCTRTVLLSNLVQGTTHADITDAVRGGLLLEIFLRYKERSASISFLREEDARTFYDHTRRQDLYIKQTRVRVTWNSRQFVLSSHVGRKIASGATRNLVIHHCSPDITERKIRDDLEHIHNLIVVKVEFIKDDCYVSTNSVGLAVFARTCMISRRTYKGCQIEFGRDECAQSLERLPRARRTVAVPLAKTSSSATNTMENRFKLLGMADV